MTVLTATLTCPRCQRTAACTSTSARHAERLSGQSAAIAASSAPMGRADARPGRL